jgi:hypothetical protein
MDYMSTKDITKEIRENLKKEFPGSKFSVSFDGYSGGSHIYVALLQSDINPLKEGNYYQINQYYIKDSEKLTDEGKVFFQKVDDIITKRHYDHSDSQIDYFNTNFYYTMSVGKWNKEYIQVA